MSSLRTLTTVNEQYRTRFQTYAPRLADLEAEHYIDTVLGSGTRSGYTYAYRAGEKTWSCAADPAAPRGDGDRYFFVDESGVIRMSGAGTANSGDEPID